MKATTLGKTDKIPEKTKKEGLDDAGMSETETDGAELNGGSDG